MTFFYFLPSAIEGGPGEQFSNRLFAVDFIVMILW
jgi:hypothetical protein